MVSFSLCGRILAVLTCIAFVVAGAFEIGDSFELGIYTLFMAPVVGLVEMPAFCACFSWCQVFAKYLKYVAGWWWIRALIYIGVSAGAYAIYAVKKGNIWLLVVHISLTCAAALFLIATFRGEENPAFALLKASRAKNSDTATTEAATQPGKPANSGVWGLFGSRSKEEAVGKAVLAAAPTVGATMFDTEKATPTAPSTDDKKRMFSGTLFGSSSGSKGNKYGYGDDLPEANPFVSK